MARWLIENNWYLPVEDLEPDEIRISFMGTSFTARVGQACNSVFIEVGTGQSFVFDCGSGVITKYTAMGIPSSRMTQVFLTHLHARPHERPDHAVLLRSGTRPQDAAAHLRPQRPRPQPREYKDQGTKAFCDALLQPVRVAPRLLQLPRDR